MAFRINVQSTIPDARAAIKKKQFEATGIKSKIGTVYVVDCYSIDAKLSPKQQQKAALLFQNPLVEKATINSFGVKQFSYAIEISYLPGVTDNIGHTSKETLEDGLKIKFKPGTTIYSSQVLFISGKISEEDATKITNILYNPLIQKATIKSFKEFKKQKGLLPNLPKVNLSTSTNVISVNLNLPDHELSTLGKLGIKDKDGKPRGPLSLDLDQLKVIRNYFHRIGRLPTDIELEALAQTWSEHCKHTIFADPLDELKDGLYKTYIKRATQVIREKKGKDDFCVSVFTDNSGAIVFDEQHLITHKVETHNTPSSLDPFGGAITGIVGVNRDSLGFGLGAKPVINTYGFCVADPGDKTQIYREESLTQPMLSARRILDGVVSGVNAGGNQSGIPTNSGFVYFDPRYRGKPLVFAGTVGLIPTKVNGKPSHLKNAKAGDYIVMLGGKVGLDGIHGATFSSEGLDKDSPATAVQIGDPITQKKFSDAIAKEARDQGLFSSITDNGAGGLSSSIGEMARETGGCLVFLDKVPVKYPGLAPWQIWISESQERMTLAVPKNKWKKFSDLMKKRGVEATIIGSFTNSGKCVVKFKNKTVLDLSLDFLHDGRPIRYQISDSGLKDEQSILQRKNEILNKNGDKNNLNLKSLILNLLSRPNITSYEYITKQYDHEVQAGSVTKPVQGAGRVNSEATVTRPVLNSPKGVVLSYGINPLYSDINTYHMAASAVDSAIRSAVAAGANLNHLALLDNFCWYSGNDPESLGKLKHAVKACYDLAVAFGTPYISGKDSMFNDFKGFDSKGNPIKISVPPTLLISAISVIRDASKAVTVDTKTVGDFVYILGETKSELGGSEYESMNRELGSKNQESGQQVPKVDVKKNLKLYQTLQSAIEKELVASAISISKGGLAAAVAKTAIGGQLGIEINLQDVPGKKMTVYEILFSESQGRILVTVDPKKAKKFESEMQGNTFAKIGTVTEAKTITINYNNNQAVIPLKDASTAYKKTFKDF